MNKKAWWAAVLVAWLIFMAAFIFSVVKADDANAAADEDQVHQHKCMVSGDTHPYVTKPEWWHLIPGMPRRDVIKLLDGLGTKQTNGNAGYWYQVCGVSSDRGRVVVWYHDGKLKGAAWVVFWNGHFIDRQLLT